MKNRSLVSIDDLTTEEALKILDDAVEFEKNPVQKLLEGKVIATLFLNHQPGHGSALKVQLTVLEARLLAFRMQVFQVFQRERRSMIP